MDCLSLKKAGTGSCASCKARTTPWSESFSLKLVNAAELFATRLGDPNVTTAREQGADKAEPDAALLLGPACTSLTKTKSQGRLNVLKIQNTFQGWPRPARNGVIKVLLDF